MAKDYKEQTNRSRTKGGKYEKKKKNMEIERSFNGTRQLKRKELQKSIAETRKPQSRPRTSWCKIVLNGSNNYSGQKQ